MIFALICHDKPNSLELRLATRPDHLEHVAKFKSHIKQVGPLLDDDGNPCGSLLILDMDSKADVEAFAAADPYAKVGLFGSVEIRGWKVISF